MSDILVVIDCQNDFIYGPLGNEHARDVVKNIQDRCKLYYNSDKPIYFTLDTHNSYYGHTVEGKHVPPHCIANTEGQAIIDDLEPFLDRPNSFWINKSSFGSVELMRKIDQEYYSFDKLSVEFVGVCTDICVITNALMCRTFNPYIDIAVHAGCCAGTSIEKHLAALEVMQSCNIKIIGG